MAWHDKSKGGYYQGRVPGILPMTNQDYIKPPEDTKEPKTSGRVGWTCPQCGRVYAPDVLTCSRCSKAADCKSDGDETHLVE
ncbi:MAG TPA: hypothetical protein VMW24_08340 [Sedimentisphaerales bacterium]|nr:hypothetical protein [Sedimentisphaerales bacterium]